MSHHMTDAVVFIQSKMVRQKCMRIASTALIMLLCFAACMWRHPDVIFLLAKQFSIRTKICLLQKAVIHGVITHSNLIIIEISNFDLVTCYGSLSIGYQLVLSVHWHCWCLAASVTCLFIKAYCYLTVIVCGTWHWNCIECLFYT